MKKVSTGILKLTRTCSIEPVRLKANNITCIHLFEIKKTMGEPN